MDLRKIFSNSVSKHLSSKQALSDHPKFPGAEGSQVGGAYHLMPRRDLRSAVARRFMLMNEAHDRIRTQLLTRHWPGLR